jgi:tRNA A-37 threonylcarbamoyl transferase component Bud32
MTLTVADIAELSRLLDLGLALAPGERQAWLRGLADAQPTLVVHLRHMFDDDAARAGGLLSEFPRLGDAVDADPSDPSPGDLVGAYRLVEEIGRGGMGSVWRADRVDGIFEREVALKLPRLAKGPRLAERMARERQIGALLEHPNIARLYDAGVDAAGRPYLVMERIRGVDVVTHAARRALDTAARLRLVLQACEAIAHAHRRLVVHRDIKPSNLLVDERGELKLLDFGIARLIDAEAEADGSVTVPDSSLQTHTPRYAAPEQRGGSAPISTAMDIYSLGVVTHELLTGGRPGTADPVSPEDAAALGPDLARVLRCALSATPAGRYGSVELLADDLRRVLARRPVRAGTTSTPHRVRLFFARHRAALTASFAAICLAAGAGLLLAREHAREAAQAQRALQASRFVLDLLEDAEPATAPGSGPVTSLQMLDSALERARHGFAGQPALRANVLVELGHMFQVLGQPEHAFAVLRDAEATLVGAVPADDPLLHLARAYLAIAFLDRDDDDAPRQAGERARTVLAGCRGDARLCAKADAYAHDVLRNLANAHGDLPEALRQARASVADYRRGFGDAHAETALAWRSLAIIQRNQGDLRDAALSIEAARRIAESAPLRAADALDLRMKQALLELDLGDLARARAELEALVAAPAPAPARVEQRRLLSQVLLAQGLLPAAEATADAALGAARDARRPWDVALALQTRALARGALGRTQEAQRDIAATADALRELGLPEASVPRQRVQWFAAEIALRGGQLEAATAIAGPLVPLAGVNRAQWLVLRGVIARQRGDARGAVALHAEAAALLAADLPPAHPLRLRNALDLAIARWLALGAGDRAALAMARDDYVRGWPPGSAWKDVPDARSASAVDWQRVVL